MKLKTLMTLLFILSTSAFAKSMDGVRISPIVGFEKVYKMLPTPHLKTRMIVGVRALWGPGYLSAEAEATRAEDSEDFPTESLTVKEESYVLKLGLRSSANLGQILRVYLRAGGQGRKTTRDITELSVARTEEPAVYVSPYAGAGFAFNLGGNLFANAGVTVVFTGRPKGSDQEYQTTLGMGMKF